MITREDIEKLKSDLEVELGKKCEVLEDMKVRVTQLKNGPSRFQAHGSLPQAFADRSHQDLIEANEEKISKLQLEIKNDQTVLAGYEGQLKGSLRKLYRL